MEQYGFVLINRVGAYGVEHRKLTHGGDVVGIRWQYDLNAATVFNRPYGELKNAVNAAVKEGAVKVSATSKREVLLGKKENLESE